MIIAKYILKDRIAYLVTDSIMKTDAENQQGFVGFISREKAIAELTGDQFKTLNECFLVEIPNE